MHDSSLLEKLDPEPVYIRTKSNERYACRFPMGKSTEKGAAEEQDDASSMNTAHVIAPLIEKHKCIQDAQSYWTYEYCFGSKLRQYHVDVVDGSRKVTAEYVLGRELPEVPGSEEAASGSQKAIPKKRIGEQDFPYHSVKLRDGTPCDLSGTPRQAEVIFICLADVLQTRLLSVKETQTCEYEALVAVPQLCNIPSYRLPKEEIHPVYCSPADGSPTKPSGLIEGQNSGQTEFVHMGMGNGEKLIILRRGAQQQQAAQQSVPDQPTQTITYFGDVPPGNGEPTADPDTGGASADKPSTPAYPSTPATPDKSLIRQFLSGSFCLDGGSGWWLYEFCFGRHVLQYHKEPNSRKRVEILLGKWDEAIHTQWLAKSPAKKKKGYYYYSNGDVCDITQKPRSVTVKMRCKAGDHPSQVAMSLDEPSTCNYILTVESPIFCPLLESAGDNGKLKIPEP